MGNALSEKELKLIDAYWRAANYLSVGQIYLYDNPLLKKPLKKDHVKPRLLGHWGTTPGLNFLYAHFNRVIKQRDLNMIYIIGPGHGGPGIVANAYLEGTYSEVYPNISQDEEGMKRLFKQFSFPGGIPSHVAPETPGSIHEGGELGYAVSHAYGAAYDNPNLIVACVVGDGEAETGPLATSWHSNKFLNPLSDGVVLPILHLNGYKIANPCVLARISHQELDQLFRGYGYTPHFVEGSDPEKMHQLMAATLDNILEDIHRIKADARRTGAKKRPLWPMIILRSPKGWTCPKEIDGKRTEDYWRSHQVPMGEMHEKPERQIEARAGGTATEGRPPHECQSPREWRFAAQGSAPARLSRLCRRGDEAGRRQRRIHSVHGKVFARYDETQHGEPQFPAVQSGRKQLQPLAGRAGSDQSRLDGGLLSVRRSPSAGWPGHGNAQRASMSGLARRLSPDRPTWVLFLLRGVYPYYRLDVQSACEVAEGLR
jgi:transketolase N-terminal domain/subunit